MMKIIFAATLTPLFAVFVSGLSAGNDTSTEKKTPPKAFVQFGINPEGITSPEMRDALTRLHGAGIVKGSRGSLTFFRWSNTKPPKLAHLGLWGDKIDNETLTLISALPHLEHVSLYETNVDDNGLKSLTQLPNLRSFAVLPIARYEKRGFGPPQWSYPFMPRRDNRPRITGQGLRILADNKSLESLDLLDARLKSGDLETLSAWPKLSGLSLPNVIDDETVKHLQSCHKLSTLTLGYREISADELKTLAAWKSLRRLTLIHTQLSDDALRALSKLDTVEELHLQECGLNDDHLRHILGSPKLTRLSLERNEIEGPGLKHLAALNLKSLGLEFNDISDKTLHHLLQLTSLESLALNQCRGVTDVGVQSGTFQKMTHLKALGLRGLASVTDASVDDLVKLSHLEHINVRSTKVSLDGVERMKRAMPKTIVFK